MKYCRYTTLNHSLAISNNNCIQSINELIVSEGYKGSIPLFVNSEIVLNMDLIDNSLAIKESRNNWKSMDMAFGIKNFDSTKIQMLLVELRLNYNNPNNLNRQEIEDKVKYSSLILSENPPLYKRYIFIFKTEQIQEAISRLFRMIPKIESNYVVMDINQLKETYF